MKKLTTKWMILVLAVSLTGCVELQQIMGTMMAGQPLTTTEIIAGLKQALTIGADSSLKRISKTDGYYRDELIKILLPPEAKTITDNLARIPGGEKLVEDVVLRINRAAEDAAREALPIFASAVTGMTIQDGLAILKGHPTAATDYLRSNTYDQLFALYQPKIKNSIDKKLIGNISTAESWNKLTTEWNKIANSLVGQMAGFKPVNVQLDSYLTGKALDGLFLKVGEEEKKIRTDPVARVTELLKRVFGATV
ncbi:MAG TPA: DUF4197 domain-containing protein [Prolixibacteraceae bacterium]|jgi:hypothetical protein|nr:DUF4197 domain-containing protein [Prolixibacteraceae bacterium]HOY50372.1 DUF4197 domain-containing protein [Prolixibacteraceae bacterium]HPJ79193.1 DUF4197 domain-containing protein [Prolixibacteraceae bacterium]HRV89280.1 DUF4197 domain-containing protein [Prolixibacteraceae bacterium]